MTLGNSLNNPPILTKPQISSPHTIDYIIILLESTYYGTTTSYHANDIYTVIHIIVR